MMTPTCVPCGSMMAWIEQVAYYYDKAYKRHTFTRYACITPGCKHQQAGVTLVIEEVEE